jgi:hypothetical protein
MQEDFQHERRSMNAFNLSRYSLAHRIPTLDRNLEEAKAESGSSDFQVVVKLVRCEDIPERLDARIEQKFTAIGFKTIRRIRKLLTARERN